MFGRIALVLTATVLCNTGCAEKKLLAEHVFLDAVIYTADADQRTAEAMAVAGDKIVFIGSNKGAMALIGATTTVDRLDGKMLIPGLHDSHIHLPGIIEGDSCDLASEPHSLEQLVPRLQQCIKDQQLPAGEWLSVDQWAFSSGNQPSEKLPTLRAALDEVSRQHPIVLLGNDGHHGATNSAALALASDEQGKQIGLNRTTLATEFAQYKALIGTDEFGEPNGIINENARKLVHVPNLWGYPELTMDRYNAIASRLAESGITSVLDAALSADEIDRFAQLARQQPLSYRMSAAFFTDFSDYRSSADKPAAIAALIATLSAARDRNSDVANLKVDTAKVFVDGVIEGDPLANPPTLPNAAQLNPYLQPLFDYHAASHSLSVRGYVDTSSDGCQRVQRAPETVTSEQQQAEFYAKEGFFSSQCQLSYGVFEEPENFIHDYTVALFKAGFSVHSHAIGDRAVRLALDSFAAARKAAPEAQGTLMMAHVQLVHQDDIRRFAELQVYPVFTYAWIEPLTDYLMMVTPFIDKVLSADDLLDDQGYAYQNSYPAASILAAGGRVAGGSDAPVDTRDPRPFFNIEKAVTRGNDLTGAVYNSAEKLSLTDALDSYTIRGAQALRQEALTGSLEVGKKADFVILQENLFDLVATGRSDSISDARILSTWFDGEKIYSAD
jgi:predicted amidohydrolase YtcJ